LASDFPGSEIGCFEPGDFFAEIAPFAARLFAIQRAIV
jgi:hypothetical protein